jgi:hypothetical protein
VRIEALLRNRVFVAAYTCARDAWRAGVAVMFRMRRLTALPRGRVG